MLRPRVGLGEGVTDSDARIIGVTIYDRSTWVDQSKSSPQARMLQNIVGAGSKIIISDYNKEGRGLSGQVRSLQLDCCTHHTFNAFTVLYQAPYATSSAHAHT